ncbi:uncharacterized protein LOC124459058 isoform X2 [Xenia sp. Carnegie-2017]|uniref:uncharacterized protein LOC124459058 isoform X2 n=1 Tax=Xenia sp. Carnegie-2017 TaxID=2897299 RepID=UPI001F044BED|nr:uncharacterized protein LOC124459058 isoform X2 [Xenia sp. Carnegie-2017]
MFEPLANAQGGHSNDNSPSSEDEYIHRFGNVEWCECGFCVVMSTGRESICCQEKHNATRCTDSGRLGCMASWEKSTDYPYLLVLETKSGKHFLRLLENTKDLNMLNTTECDIYVA